MFVIWDALAKDFIKDIGSVNVRYFHSEEELRFEEHLLDAHRYKLYPFTGGFWGLREYSKIDNLEYHSCVWSKEAWFRERIFVQSVFPHVLLSDPEVVYYTPSAKKGEKDIQEPIKAGKFLQKYYGDILDQTKIKYWSDLHRETYAEAGELTWYKTPEELAYVYSLDSTFYSCMQGKEWPFKGHPVSVYGAGDIHCAAIVKNGRVFARALVWPAKNKVGRIYGDVALLRKALKDYGIKTESNQAHYDDFEGARLISRFGAGGVVLPYIDGKVCGVKPSYSGLTITTLSDPDAEWCAHDSEGFVYRGTRCSHCDSLIDDQAEFVDPEGDKVVCEECVLAVAFWCTVTLKHYSYDSFSCVEINGRQLCYEACEGMVFKSDWSNVLFFNDESVTLTDGRRVSASELQEIDREERQAA